MNMSARVANRRVLIIDDTASIHQDFRKVLCQEQGGEISAAAIENVLFGAARPERQTFEIDSAYQGREALDLVKLALAEGRPYALAFVDMRMPPGWDGLETIEQIWEVDPHLQVALCTAYSDYSWEAIAKRLKFDDQLLILKKPFDDLEILQMATALTRKWQMAQDSMVKTLSLEHSIEERVEELLKLSHLLQYDALTELPNSTLIGDRLTHSIALSKRHNKQLAVMFLGLDRFNRINNALGYSIGDEMLKLVAQSLINTVRQSDSVFRYGADEFVLVLNDIHHPHQTKGIAEKLLATLSVPRYIDGHDLSVTASVGISIYPDDAEDALTLIKNAEIAMRSVKEHTSNDFCFFIDDMNQRAREQQSIESGIRLALERNEFVLCYQPKLDLESGKVVGAEALIRWLHPQRGWISPSDFISIAEDSGLIVPLSKWVLRQACRQTCAWRAAGLPPICMSVNISAVEFRQRDFLKGIHQVLEETGITPNLLELEITESVFMQDIDSTIAILQAIKGMGIRLTIDDFGTGYSSLSYLQRFPIDVLKIDQSFVRNLNTSSNDTALVSAIIRLGKSLKLTVIAEGIETLEQLEFLRAHQCDEGQGYYFSKAVDASAFATLLIANSMSGHLMISPASTPPS
jgi:diguanylate cyclase (GGDEF)-like protein